MEEKAIAKIEQTQIKTIVNIEDYAMTLESLEKQVDLIQSAMKRVMKKDEHYGIIPGTPKPTLLKPGAEKLCLLFRFGPKYSIIEKTRQDRFIAYTVACDLYHTPTNTFVASGIGSCNSYEVKYRYRSEDTGKEVPPEYWKHRDPELLGGPEYKPRKKDGKWYIFHTVENDNPWDLDNTLIKMACKRALIAAVLNATAASDIFTQDLDDLPENFRGNDNLKNADTISKYSKENSNGDKVNKIKKPTPITQNQKKKLFTMMTEAGLSKEEAKEFYETYKPETSQQASKFINDFKQCLSEWQQSKQEAVEESEDDGIPEE